MPGTIHVSVLELVGLPSPPQSSSSSMGVKVSMGKQEREIQDKEETSLQLASLRDNLNVFIHDSQGNEIAHTDVETRSIVEKGTWDDIFPLKGGGTVRLKLQFYLTEDEQNRIRSMRESAARKQQEDFLKGSHSSSGLAGSSGVSLQDSFKSRERSNLDPSYSQANKISAESNVKDLNKAQPGQKKQVFSTSKSTGALDKVPAYHQLKERLHAEQQAQLDTTPSNEEPPSSSTQLSRTTEDISSKVPRLKKTVTLNTKPILPNIEIAPAPSLPEQIEKERGKQLPPDDKLNEAAMLTSTQVNSPSKPPILKNTVSISTRPVLSKSKPAPSTSFTEEIKKEREKVLPATNETKENNLLSGTAHVETPALVPSLKKTFPINTKPVLSSFKTTPSPSTPDEVGKESTKDLPAICATRTTVLSSISTANKEENLHISPLSERSTFSLKKLLASLPRTKKLLTDKFNEKQGFNANDPFLIEKKWRSKHWRSYQHIAKSKVFHGNKLYSIDRFRGWMFLEEKIYPCLLTDNRPFIDALKGCISDTSLQLDDHEKLEDAGVTHSKSDKGLNGLEKAESTRRPNKANTPFSAPAGQVMKIAIMVGFGLLVILTRQKK